MESRTSKPKDVSGSIVEPHRGRWNSRTAWANLLELNPYSKSKPEIFNPGQNVQGTFTMFIPIRAVPRTNPGKILSANRFFCPRIPPDRNTPPEKGGMSTRLCDAKSVTPPNLLFQPGTFTIRCEAKWASYEARAQLNRLAPGVGFEPTRPVRATGSPLPVFQT